MNSAFKDWGETLFYVGSFLFIIWLLVDGILLTRYKGKLRRGIPIRSEQLSDDIAHFLATLSTDVRDRNGFIRKEGSSVLIRTRLAGKVFLPHVATVNLKSDLAQVRIVYRTTLTALIVLVIFSLTIVLALLLLPAAVFGHLLSRNAIHTYVRMKMKEYTP